MILRLVKMTFDENEIDTFLAIFSHSKIKIEGMPGCLSVQLKQDVHQKNIFFTLSEWETEQDLENYRNSELFIHTWKKVKPLFTEKAQAWSLS